MNRFLAIGLMSGTTRDGVDVALVETDGDTHVRPIDFSETPYTPAAREVIAHACAVAAKMDKPWKDEAVDEAERIVTGAHVGAIQEMMRKHVLTPDKIDVIGFHGHTVAHKPAKGWTWQIGNGQMMSEMLNIAVASDFSSADIAAGGEGAPLIPVFLRAICATMLKPLAVLNLGGIGNFTYIGADGSLIAFDTGVANAMLDDWVLRHTGEAFDRNGDLAARGMVNDLMLGDLLRQTYFDRPPPKSLDRDELSMDAIQYMSPADGAATLTAFTAQSVANALRFLPEKPHRILATGGGRHNMQMMRMIAHACQILVEPIDQHGWNGDAIEAQGYGYIAVRAMKHEPITFPSTTGCSAPVTCGQLHRPGYSLSEVVRIFD